MAKHEVRLDRTKIGRGVQEILEDRLADVLLHYQDPMCSEKASEITIKLKVTPIDEARDQFALELSGGTRVSARKSVAVTMFAGVNAAGVMEATEYNPRQMRMFEGSAVLDEGVEHVNQ